LPEISNLLSETSFSFPSGHAAFFFALATTTAVFDRRLGILLLIGAALVSLARVAAGIHYPSDVLAGALIGFLFGYLTKFFLKKSS
jgi:undecaprenyl-diphosphatase